MRRAVLTLLLMCGCTHASTEGSPDASQVVDAGRSVAVRVSPQLPPLDGPRPQKIEPPRGRIVHPVAGPTCEISLTLCEDAGAHCSRRTFGIQCGETQKLPDTRELVSCVCP